MSRFPSEILVLEPSLVQARVCTVQKTVKRAWRLLACVVRSVQKSKMQRSCYFKPFSIEFVEFGGEPPVPCRAQMSRLDD